MDLIERAQRYVAEIPGAVSGSGGDRQTYKVACILVHKFDLEWDDAWEIYLDYNRRCSPPWQEADLERKLDIAFQSDSYQRTSHAVPIVRRSVTSQSARKPISPTVGPSHDLVALAEEEAKKIVIDYQMPVDQWEKRSPIVQPTDPSEAWKLWLRLFDPGDVIWIGERHDSGREDCESNFRTVEHWLQRPWSPHRNGPIPIQIWGQLTCPATFKPGSYSRCKLNILRQPYIVLESDTLSKAESGGLFRWLDEHDILRLRCVVDSGNKSLHGWFDMPHERDIPLLKDVLTVLGCDRSMFTPSQPVRLPGGWRNQDKARPQKVLYLDL